MPAWLSRMASGSGCVLLYVWLGACAAGASASGDAAALHPRHVLIVGNSITYTNNLPAILYALIQANQPGQAVTVDMYVKGGAQLTDLDRDAVFRDTLTQDRYDDVVIQERGGNALCAATVEGRAESQCGEIIAAHRDVAALVRTHASTVYYLGTYQGGADSNQRLEQGESWLSHEMGAQYIDLADPWQYLWDAHPDYPWLYSKTNIHPGPALSVLMAVEIYHAIYRRYPAVAALCTTARMFPPDMHFEGLVTFSEVNAPAAGNTCLISAEQMQVILEKLKQD